MFDDEYYIYVKRKSEKEIFKIPGVKAVGLGPKTVKGIAIGELAIQVFVKNKKPIHEIADKEIIPSEISNIPTDVVEWNEPASLAATLTIGGCASGNIISATEIKEGGVVKQVQIDSPGHGLADGNWITIRGANTDIQGSFSHQVTVINPDRFSINTIENSNSSNPFVNAASPGSAKWIKISTFDTLCSCPTGDITGTEPASSPVVIIAPGHGLNSGDRIKIKDTGPQLLPVIFKIQKVNNDKFKLPKDADTDFFSHATSGWKWFKVSIPLEGRVKRYEKVKPVIIHSVNHGLADKDRIVVNSIEPNFNNHLRRDKSPYVVTVLDNSRFTLKEKVGNPEGDDYADLDATNWSDPNPNEVDFVAVWIRQEEDLSNYSRLRGGIRVQVVTKTIHQKQIQVNGELVFVEYTPRMIDTSSSTQGMKDSKEKFRDLVSVNVGTLGCIAIDLLSNPRKKVFLSNAHVIAAVPEHPEVHHPTYYDSSTDCSSHRVGNLVRHEFPKTTDPPNSITVDAAISNIKKDIASDALIVDIGPVKGTHRIRPTEIVNRDYRIWKRGAMTKLTEAVVTSVEHTFPSAEDRVTWNNQILAEPIAGVNKGFVNVLGDSGSVLVNKDNMVVGLLHKGTAAGECIASHIDEVETKLHIKIWKEGDVVADVDAGEAENEELAIRPGIPRLLTDAVAELTNAGAGNVVAIVQTHYLEVYTLVKTNQKFAFVWYHNHGPELIKQLRIAVSDRTKPIPSIIRQKPFLDLLGNIFTALKKYGSEKLKTTIETNELWLVQILQLPYEDMLEQFKQQKEASRELKPVIS